MPAKVKFWFVVFYAVILLIVSTISLLYFNSRKASILKEVELSLSTIGKMKVSQLSDWYVDELHDAKVLASNNFLLEKLKRWVQSGFSGDLEQLLMFLRNIASEHDYEAILLLGENGELLGSTNPRLTEIDSLLKEQAQLSSKNNVTLSTNLYRCKLHNEKQIDFLSPIVDPVSGKIFILVFRISPHDYIFPLLQQWPAPSATAESVLLKEAGSYVLFLNESRHIGDSLFMFEISGDKDQIPAVRAAKGEVGFIKGTDYRGEEVYAFIDSIPKTEWYLVSKVDQKEYADDLRWLAINVFVISFLIIVVAGLAIGFSYNLQQKKYYRDLWQMQEEFKTTLYSIGDGVITTDKAGRIMHMNPVAELLTGWNEMDAKSKKLESVFQIVNEYSGLLAENPVAKVLEQGMVVGLANHTMLISKTGNKIPIADSGAPIKDDKGNIAGVVLVFRDQSEERAQRNELEESKRKMATLMSNLPGMAYRCKNDADWTMEFVSEGCFSLTGYLTHEMINNKVVAFGEIIVPSFRSMIDREVQEAVNANKPYRFEYQIKKRDGNVAWVWEQGVGVADFTGSVVALEGFIIDITERKNSEQEKMLLANALQASINEIFMFDADNLKFIYANQGALRNLGYHIDEIHQMTPLDIKPDYDHGSFQKLISPLLLGTQDTVVAETVHERKDKSQYPVEIHLQLFKQLDRTLFLAVVIDITERKKSQEALQRSEEEYRNLFDNHAAVKLLVDPYNGAIVNANKAAEKFYGWSKAELVQMNISHINTMSPDQIRKEMDNARLYKRNHFEFKHCLADGSVRDVEVFTSPVMFSGKSLLHSIIHDITERKEAEHKINLLSRSIEQSPVCVMITNVSGELEYVNAEFTHVTGYELVEVIGKNPRILQSGIHKKKFYKELWDTILSGQSWHGEMFNKKKNGDYFWEDAIIVPILDDRKKITHFVALKEDITEKKKIFDELINAKRRAEESERLKTAFLANMSHEIRTPLNSILGFTGFLTSEEELSPQEKELYAGIINKSAEGLLQIINDILDISRLETGQVVLNNKHFDITQSLKLLLVQSIRKRNEMKKAHLHISLEQPNEALMVKCDEIRLTQIFNNLIGNALKYTSEGEIRFGISKITKKKIQYFVSDTGIGIKPEEQSKVFERFRQLDDTSTRALGGNGLGLTIVKYLIDLMNGEIILESEYGKGTTFWFTLPL
jgi:PAS domain S-box-containing protein